ncbi:hypothetical protein EVAR_99730_1 [Eumeta japonica]|uniref:Uncharacterized protein n=1 Tax=Eumeta variegata TaxID=151549 RepID=A0A4C1Z7R3_EUMVA|nr:hypothetical protein EVAR_99730_1 [Eumeta japonica]
MTATSKALKPSSERGHSSMAMPSSRDSSMGAFKAGIGGHVKFAVQADTSKGTPGGKNIQRQFDLKKSEASSAKSASWTSADGHGALFTYAEYSSGESVEPCGTPVLIGLIDESVLSSRKNEVAIANIFVDNNNGTIWEL